MVLISFERYYTASSDQIIEFLRWKHFDPVFPFICDVCVFTFYSKEYLKLHLTKYIDFKKENFRNRFSMLILMFGVSLFIRKILYSFICWKRLIQGLLKASSDKKKCIHWTDKFRTHFLHVDWDVCYFNSHSKEYLKLHLTK